MVTTNRDRVERRRARTRALRQRGDGRVRRDDHVHPSRGGRSGYPVYTREQCLRLVDAGIALDRPGDPHRTTIARWQTQHAVLGFLDPKVSCAGRRRRAPESDVALVHLLQRMFPTMMNFEMRRMITRYTGREYSDTDLVRIRKDYNPDVTTSRQKVESHATEHDPILRNMWRTLGPPYGHVGVHSQRMLDFDEMGVYFTHTQVTGWLGPRAITRQLLHLAHSPQSRSSRAHPLTSCPN